MRYLGFDTRALSLMRVCVAAVIMLDLGVRLSDLETFYANTGAVPLTMLYEHAWNDYFISLHAISGLWQVQLILFIVQFVCATLLLIGYRTQLFTCISWFMLLSLHNRNGLILQGGDDLLRMVLFWAMFLPWGARYSCDAILGAPPPPREAIVTTACVGYLLQICYIYTGSALLKGREWDTDYSAMYYVYSLDQIAYPVTRHLLYHPSLLRALTIAAYYFELLVPLLFFIPYAHQAFRTIAVVLIVAFHALNSLTLFIGMFPLIGVATVTGLLPTSAMDWLERRWARMKPVVRDSFAAIAGNLQWLIRWRPPAPPLHGAMRNVRVAVLIFLIVFVFDWNFSNLSFIRSKLSDDLRFIGYTLRLDQNWGMFAPGVFKDDGWYVCEATDEDGKVFNLLDPASPLSYSKPASVVDMFKNDRWRKFSENLVLQSHAFMRGYFVNFTRRVWNEEHPERQLRQLNLVYMSEFTKPGYEKCDPERLVLWSCY